MPELWDWLAPVHWKNLALSCRATFVEGQAKLRKLQRSCFVFVAELPSDPEDQDDPIFDVRRVSLDVQRSRTPTTRFPLFLVLPQPQDPLSREKCCVKFVGQNTPPKETVFVVAHPQDVDSWSKGVVPFTRNLMIDNQSAAKVCLKNFPPKSELIMSAQTCISLTGNNTISFSDFRIQHVLPVRSFSQRTTRPPRQRKRSRGSGRRH